MLWSTLPGYKPRSESDQIAYLACFRLGLERCDANVCHPRPPHDSARCRSIGRGGVSRGGGGGVHGAAPESRGERVFARRSPAAHTARWAVPVPSELVKLPLLRGGSIELVAESWATARAGAEKMGHDAVLAVLQEYSH